MKKCDTLESINSWEWLERMILSRYAPDDIVKIVVGDKVVLGRVVSSTDTDVEIYRASGNVWYKCADYEIENLGSCII